MRNPFVYDKAKYHHDSQDFPKDLSIKQAFVHTGMFLGWVVDNDLCSEDFKKSAGELLDAFKKREVLSGAENVSQSGVRLSSETPRQGVKHFLLSVITGANIFERLDGVLTEEDLTAEGNAFAQYYFDFDKGQYLKDYEKLLASNLPSSYHVKDTWENYERIKEVIGRRYDEWKKSKL